MTRRTHTVDGQACHTCTETGSALPFGRKAPAGECPRCDELRNGAAPRTYAWADNRKRQATSDDRHRCTSACPRVCTSADW